MAPHSSTLAWKIPWMEEPGRLQSMGSPRVAKGRTRLSDFTFTFHFHALEKEMATHSRVLAWRIPGTAGPGGLPSIGLQSRTRLKRLSSSRVTETQSRSETVTPGILKEPRASGLPRLGDRVGEEAIREGHRTSFSVIK